MKKYIMDTDTEMNGNGSTGNDDDKEGKNLISTREKRHSDNLLKE